MERIIGRPPPRDQHGVTSPGLGCKVSGRSAVFTLEDMNTETTTSRRRRAFDAHIEEARDAMRRREWLAAEALLDRAHVIGQPSAVDHVRSHAWMLLLGWRKRDAREIAGQLWRLLVAAPASLLGKYPAGNTGRTNVSGFVPMPIPDDLRDLLGRDF